MNNNDLLFEVLKDIQRDVKDIREEQIKQGYDIKENTEDLKEHMARTELLEGRVELLEESEIGKKYLWKYIAGFSTVLGIASILYGLYLKAF